MKTQNIEGLSIFEINTLVQQGGKFISFPYAVSGILKKIRRNSDVYFIRPEESSFKYAFKFFFSNLIAGWFLPWGPVNTIKSLYYILRGGKDITLSILADLVESVPVNDFPMTQLQTSELYAFKKRVVFHLN